MVGSTVHAIVTIMFSNENSSSAYFSFPWSCGQYVIEKASSSDFWVI